MAFALGVAPCLFAQTPPDYVNHNPFRGGVEGVEFLKYVLQPNTKVDLNNYQEWIAWGSTYEEGCPHDIIYNELRPEYYSTRKIDGKIIPEDVQHCDEMRNEGMSTFSWENGALYPKNATNSRGAFYVHHKQSHFIPVESGKTISVKVWLTTHPALPSATNPNTGFLLGSYHNWDGTGIRPDSPDEQSRYRFNWENPGEFEDHAYTINITPTFTGILDVDVGPDYTGAQIDGVWLKAVTVENGSSSGVVQVGSYVAKKFTPQYFINFKHREKVMQPDFDPVSPVKLATLTSGEINQMWYLHESNTPGYYNIWTRDGALTTDPYTWETRSLEKPDLNDVWQQVQFEDQGNGTSQIKLGGEGPAGEDLYLITYDDAEGTTVYMYFDLDPEGQEVELIQANGPVPGVPYQVQYEHSGKCLAVAGASQSNGANIEQQTCTMTSNQILTLNQEAGGFYSLRF